MKLSTEQINSLLDEAKPALLDSLKNDILSSVSWQLNDAVKNILRDEITKWMSEEIMPEIMKELISSKESLISLGVEFAPNMVKAISESMTDKMKENLDGYNRSKIFKALFD